MAISHLGIENVLCK